jgi:trimethylguanosine synthase
MQFSLRDISTKVLSSEQLFPANVVIAIDIDPVKINCAKHNAKIYGVLDKIQFVNGDFFDHVHKVILHLFTLLIQADAVFMSPPWGGPSYSSQDMFDVEVMKPYSAYIPLRELC